MGAPETTLYCSSIHIIDTYLKKNKENPIRSFFGARVRAIPPLVAGIVDLVAIPVFSLLSVIPPLRNNLGPFSAYVISSKDELTSKLARFPALFIGIISNVVFGILIDTNINIQIQKALGLYDSVNQAAPIADEPKPPEQLEKPEEIKINASDLSALKSQIDSITQKLEEEIKKCFMGENLIGEYEAYGRKIDDCKIAMISVQKMLQAQYDDILVHPDLQKSINRYLEDALKAITDAIDIPEKPNGSNINQLKDDINTVDTFLKKMENAASTEPKNDNGQHEIHVNPPQADDIKIKEPNPDLISLKADIKHIQECLDNEYKEWNDPKYNNEHEKYCVTLKAYKKYAKKSHQIAQNFDNPDIDTKVINDNLSNIQTKLTTLNNYISGEAGNSSGYKKRMNQLKGHTAKVLTNIKNLLVTYKL